MSQCSSHSPVILLLLLLLLAVLGAVSSPALWGEPPTWAPLRTELTWARLTLVGEGTGGAPGEPREGVGMTGATSGVWAGVPGSLLLISPPDAEAEPEGPAVPPDADEVGVRVGYKTPARVRGDIPRGAAPTASHRDTSDSHFQQEKHRVW